MSWHCSQGGGGGILAGCLLGWNTVCAVEIEEYPRRILMQRQRDGQLPFFPLWDDVCTFDGTPWRGKVDIITGGFPCQDISCAGKGAGLEGKRSSLWHQMHRIICEVRPRWVFVENSPMLTSRGLGRVLGDLAESGYDAAWCVLGAADVGAPHRRNRIWILALRHTDRDHETTKQAVQRGKKTPQPCRSSGDGAMQTPPSHADTHLSGCEQQWRTQPDEAEHAAAECCGWWGAEPNVGRVADGVAARVDRLRALGNGQVPLVAATAFAILQLELLNHTATHA